MSLCIRVYMSVLHVVLTLSVVVCVVATVEFSKNCSWYPCTSTSVILSIVCPAITSAANLFMIITLNCRWGNIRWLCVNKVLSVAMAMLNIGSGSALSMDYVDKPYIDDENTRQIVLQAITWASALLSLITVLLYFMLKTGTDVAESQPILPPIHDGSTDNNTNIEYSTRAASYNSADVTTYPIIKTDGYHRSLTASLEDHRSGSLRISASHATSRRFGNNVRATSWQDGASRLFTSSLGEEGSPQRKPKKPKPRPHSRAQTVGYSSRESSPNHPTSRLLRPNSVAQ